MITADGFSAAPRSWTEGPAARHQEDFVALHSGDSIEVRPVPVAALRRPGPATLRILLFGGGPLLGRGLRDHDLGLPGHVADLVRERLERGVEMDVVADPTPMRQQAVDGLRGLRLRRYDAVVVVLGDAVVTESARSNAYWGTELVRTVLTELSQTTPVLVYSAAASAAPRSLHARRLAHLSQVQSVAVEEACARAGRVLFGELAAPHRIPLDGRPFAGSQFTEWAETAVERLARQLELAREVSRGLDPVDSGADDEALRQRALACLRLSRERSPRLDRIVEHARTMFGASGSAINIIGADEQWSRAAVPQLAPIPRSESFCAIAIESDGPMLVNDTWLDGRTRGRPLTTGDGALRFYAAYPIRTWDGYRVGTICVYGYQPRGFRRSELEPCAIWPG